MKEVKLKKAIMVDGQKVTKLKLREPIVMDLELVDDEKSHLKKQFWCYLFWQILHLMTCARWV